MSTLLTKASSLSFNRIQPFSPYTFLTATPTINHSRHHNNYATEPSTVSKIFLTLSHYEHPKVLPVNGSNILVLSRIISTIFSHYCIINTHKFCQKTIMTITINFIILLFYNFYFYMYILFLYIVIVIIIVIIVYILFYYCKRHIHVYTYIYSYIHAYIYLYI